ncbi:hypothetical protein PCCS19_43130 [Paenibacillus sp. CCS19]|uniref:hypothetical protein n=1 Tax=Paenibacillus sp. CCS19 TaxID=3158387 RepID=UPI00255EE1AB|nr:hypothetical protein [Paenibacillus cellulosilyticus]GMK41257.1 hypothetical protein PCCS19_43130 [Paenibacillus cellulosilyticus]
MRQDNSKPLVNARWKMTFDIIFVVGLVLTLIKLVFLVLNKLGDLDIHVFNDKFIWNIGPLALMVIGGIGSGALKEKQQGTNKGND